jgi:hypothetical protein
MRQTQLAVQLAMARDQLQWGLGLYALVGTGALVAAVKNRSLPHLLAPPLLIGGFVLSYMYDMAYGSKMLRVRNEAEHIFLHERQRLIPPSFAPFAKAGWRACGAADARVRAWGAQFWVDEERKLALLPGSDRRVNWNVFRKRQAAAQAAVQAKTG